MKNLLLTFVLLVITTITYANNEPVLPTDAVVTIEAIDFKMSKMAIANNAIEVTYDEQSGNIALQSAREVSFLQVFNSTGELEYQLPVFSNKLIIDLDDFDLGKYQLNIMLENETMVPATFSKG